MTEKDREGVEKEEGPGREREGAAVTGRGRGVAATDIARTEGTTDGRVTRSYKEEANSNRPIGPYMAVQYLT